MSEQIAAAEQLSFAEITTAAQAEAYLINAVSEQQKAAVSTTPGELIPTNTPGVGVGFLEPLRGDPRNQMVDSLFLDNPDGTHYNVFVNSDNGIRRGKDSIHVVLASSTRQVGRKELISSVTMSRDLSTGELKFGDTNTGRYEERPASEALFVELTKQLGRSLEHTLANSNQDRKTVGARIGQVMSRRRQA